MKIRIVYYLKYVKSTLLTILLVLMLTELTTRNSKVGYYNEIFLLKNSNYLSQDSIGLIITTVTGDKNYLNNNIEKIYTELSIIHLLVLSGSNLVILSLFLSFYIYKDRMSHNINFILAIVYYYCYINFLHPVARAVIFTLFSEFIKSAGFKFSSIKLIFLLTITSAYTYTALNFSNSFLLSFIFSFCTILFSFLKIDKIFHYPILKKYLIYPTYITVITIPISLFFFGKYNFARSLISNIIIVPFYEVLVLYMYLVYFLGLTSFTNFPFFYLLSWPLELLLKYFGYILFQFKIYNI